MGTGVGASAYLAMIDRTRSTYISETVIENHEAGLLYVEGRFVERLAPGRHAYWSVDRKVEVKRLDLRPQAIEITPRPRCAAEQPRVRLKAQEDA